MDLEDDLYYYKKCEVFVKFFHFENVRQLASFNSKNTPHNLFIIIN